VAKEAADIVLLDDNFGSFVSAFEEGRSIYKTIKKVVLYLFSTGAGEALTIICATLLFLPLPILPAQIIWLNFVTDGFLVVALGMEPKEDGLLKGIFKKPKKYLVDKAMGIRIFTMAIPMMIGTLILFSFYMDGEMVKAWTVSLTTLAVFQWFNAWNCRHETKSIFQTNPLSNKYLLGSILTVIALQLFLVYNPFMQDLFKTTALSLAEWLIILPVASSVVWVEEIRKFFYRRYRF
jgi:Ca2+-transporting ATPase